MLFKFVYKCGLETRLIILPIVQSLPVKIQLTRLLTFPKANINFRVSTVILYKEKEKHLTFSPCNSQRMKVSFLLLKQKEVIFCYYAEVSLHPKP